MTPDPTPRRTLELFVRSLASADANPKQAAALDRVGRLADAGVVADYSVYVVGREVCPEAARATEPGRFICDRILAFREWAARNGLSVDAIVEPRRVRSELTGEEYQTIVFPTVVVAAFEGDSLRGVAPCTDGETHYAVGDLLDVLEADGGPTPPAGPTPPGGRRGSDGGGWPAGGRESRGEPADGSADAGGVDDLDIEFGWQPEEPNLP